MIDEKYAARADAEIESVKESLRTEYNTAHIGRFINTLSCNGATDDEINIIVSIANKYQQDLTTKIDPDRVLVGNSSLRGTRTDALNEAKRRYDLMNRGGNIIDEETVEEVNPDDEEGNVVDYNFPYVISEESYSEDFLNHDKLQITYYAEDDTLADEQEEIIDDIDALVGYDNLDMKYTSATHPEQIYVRNERIGADYEITINLNSYQELIQGIQLEPKQRQAIMSRQRRREKDE